ncbi:hypothetical protein ACFSTC_16905 [Nonomuraea ferruginea]
MSRTVAISEVRVPPIASASGTPRIRVHRSQQAMSTAGSPLGTLSGCSQSTPMSTAPSVSSSLDQDLGAGLTASPQPVMPP